MKNLEDGKTTLRIVKHDKDSVPFVPFRFSWLTVEDTIEKLSRYSLTQIIKEKKLEKIFNVKRVEDLRMFLIVISGRG